MGLVVKEARNKKELKDFIMFPYILYRNDPIFVPPLIMDMKNIVLNKGSILFSKGPHLFFNAYAEDGKIIGRIATGIDLELQKRNNTREGYLTLFECIQDEQVAFKLFDACVAWLKDRGTDCLKGPVSPTNGDDYRGLLTYNFIDPPVLLTSYNPEYYVNYFKNYSFKPYLKLLSFKFNLQIPPEPKMINLIESIKKRFGYEVNKANFQNINQEARDLKKILDLALPEEWQDLTPPTYEEVLQMAKNLKKFTREETVIIARTLSGEPIGFIVAAPDYNQVLRLMNGRLFPFGWLKFLLYRGRINQGRAFIVFVVPSMRGKGVPASMFIKLFEYARKMGYKMAEGSTIGEENFKMIQEAKSAGGVHYKTYEVFIKHLF